MPKDNLIHMGCGMTKEEFFGAFRWNQIMITNANRMAAFYLYSDYKKVKMKAYERRKFGLKFWETAQKYFQKLQYKDSRLIYGESMVDCVQISSQPSTATVAPNINDLLK